MWVYMLGEGIKLVEKQSFIQCKNTWKPVAEYFQTLAVKNRINGELKRDSDEYKGRVYLATDDDSVFATMKAKYPKYQIFVYTSNHHER